MCVSNGWYAGVDDQRETRSGAAQLRVDDPY